MEHLNEKQRVAHDLAVTGHNVLVTGQCGTGNTTNILMTRDVTDKYCPKIKLY